MTEKKDDGLFSCTNMCWIIGALVGFALWLVLMRNAGLHFVLALILGAIVAFGIGWVLKNFFCTDIKVEAAPVAASAAVATATVAAASAAPSEAVVDEAPVANPIVEEAAEDVVATADDVADLEALDAPVETSEAVVEAADVVEEAVAPTPKPAAKKKTPAKAKVPAAETGETAEKKPRTMKAPRKAGADDLKLIKGVGPKLEGTLNDLGFYHFDQISKWGDAEISWVDNRLKFKGRITRDGWIEQAGILADGGETEFSKRGKKA